MKKVLVYTDGDRGASNACVRLAIHGLNLALANHFDSFSVGTTTAREIAGGVLRDNCSLLVVPGGRDLPYHNDLSGSGNREIGDFVRSAGGGYLGLCAGGYYGASYIEFSKGDPVLEVCGERELKLFPGGAMGPLYPGFEYGTNRGARAVNLTLTDDTLPILHLPKETTTTTKVLYNGGAYFDFSLVSREEHPETKNDCVNRGPNSTSRYEVLAYYTDFPSKPAIVACYCGSGRAVLTGVHPEAGVDGLLSAYGSDNKYINTVLAGITDDEPARQALFLGIVSFLLKL